VRQSTAQSAPKIVDLRSTANVTATEVTEQISEIIKFKKPKSDLVNTEFQQTNVTDDGKFNPIIQLFLSKLNNDT
jgi:hypothetical protein